VQVISILFSSLYGLYVACVVPWFLVYLRKLAVLGVSGFFLFVVWSCGV